MDLLLKSVIAAIIVVAILAVAYTVLKSISAKGVSESTAVSLVVNDLQRSFPGAIINVTNVSPSTYPGSWHIVLALTLNATRPCPTYEVLSYDYPIYGFVSRNVNLYTQNCVIYGFLQNKSYILAAAPVAIARSYNMSIPSVTNFVNKYGYSNINVTAAYYSKLNLLGKNYTNIWMVSYSSPLANKSINIILSQVGGNLLFNYSVPK